MYNQLPGFKNPQAIGQGIQPMPPTTDPGVIQKPPGYTPPPPPAPMVPPDGRPHFQPGDYYHGQGGGGIWQQYGAPKQSIWSQYGNAAMALHNFLQNGGNAPRPLPGQQVGSQPMPNPVQQGVGGMQPMPVAGGPISQPLPAQPPQYAGTQVPPQGVGAL